MKQFLEDKKKIEELFTNQIKEFVNKYSLSVEDIRIYAEFDYKTDEPNGETETTFKEIKLNISL